MAIVATPTTFLKKLLREKLRHNQTIATSWLVSKVATPHRTSISANPPVTAASPVAFAVHMSRST